VPTLLVDRLREAAVDVALLPVDAIERASVQYLNTVGPQEVLDLTRMAFYRTASDFDLRFRSVFRGFVESFPLRGEEQYVAVVAAHLVSELLDKNDDSLATLGALLVRTARFQGWSPSHPDVNVLADLAWRRRARTRYDLIGDPVPSRRAPGVKKALEAFAKEPDEQKTYDALQELMNELSRSRSHANQLAERVEKALAEEREQTDILWWLISGWSFSSDKKFSELDAGLLSLLAGLEMASLVRRPPGPPVVDAFLHQVLILGNASPDAEFDGELIAGDIIEDLLPVLWDQAIDFCPAIASLRKGNLQLSKPVSLGDLAREVFDEAMILQQRTFLVPQ
jgi:hypothetical protein